VETETENRSQGFKLREMECSIFNAPHNFHVINAAEGTRMEMRELQCDSVLKEEGGDVWVPSFPTYPHIDDKI
jgi:hypothetical protein